MTYEDMLAAYAAGVLFCSFLIGLFDAKSPDGNPRTSMLAAAGWPMGVCLLLGEAVRGCLTLRKFS